jgi:RHS repeat-associated protein
VYREPDPKTGAPSLMRETLHIVDGDRRIALVETRTQGTDSGSQELVRYQYANHLGSASLELDDAAQIVSYEEYFPYGSTSYQAVRSQTEVAKRYRYTGKEKDDETALSYHGARYLANWLGRWLSCDPAQLRGGHNLYAYVGGMTTVRVDSDGRLPTPAEIRTQATALTARIERLEHTISDVAHTYSLQSIGAPVGLPPRSAARTLGRRLQGLIRDFNTVRQEYDALERRAQSVLGEALQSAGLNALGARSRSVPPPAVLDAQNALAAATGAADAGRGAMETLGIREAVEAVGTSTEAAKATSYLHSLLRVPMFPRGSNGRGPASGTPSSPTNSGPPAPASPSSTTSAHGSAPDPHSGSGGARTATTGAEHDAAGALRNVSRETAEDASHAAGSLGRGLGRRIASFAPFVGIPFAAYGAFRAWQEHRPVRAVFEGATGIPLLGDVVGFGMTLIDLEGYEERHPGTRAWWVGPSGMPPR